MSVHLSLSPRLFYTEISFPVNKAYPDLIKSLMDCDNQRKNLAISYKIFSAVLILTGHRNIHLIYVVTKRIYFQTSQMFRFFFFLAQPLCPRMTIKVLDVSCRFVLLSKFTCLHWYTHIHIYTGVQDYPNWFHISDVTEGRSPISNRHVTSRSCLENIACARIPTYSTNHLLHTSSRASTLNFILLVASSTRPEISKSFKLSFTNFTGKTGYVSEHCYVCRHKHV